MDPDIYSFARTFGNPQYGQVKVRRARVISTASNTVSLRMDTATGTTHTNVEYIGAIPPKPDEMVWVLVLGGEVVCLGSTAARGGDTPVVQLTRAAAQTTGLTTSGYVDVVWTDEYGSGDPWNMHTLSPASADITVPIRGLYAVSATVSIQANVNGTYRGVRILVDGTVRATQQISDPSGTIGSGVNTILNVSWMGRVPGGQVIKVQFGHDAGVNLQAQVGGGGPSVTVTYLGAAAI